MYHEPLSRHLIYQGEVIAPMKILIPTPLRAYVEKKDSVEVAGNTVAEALEHLATQYPALRKHLFTDDGKLRSFVNVYLNEEDIRYLKQEATATQQNDTLSIIPSIAGGIEGNLQCR